MCGCAIEVSYQSTKLNQILIRCAIFSGVGRSAVVSLASLYISYLCINCDSDLVDGKWWWTECDHVDCGCKTIYSVPVE